MPKQETNRDLRAKIEATLKRKPVPEGVYDREGARIDNLLRGATGACHLIKRPLTMMRTDVPEFRVYTDWNQRVEILLAPNKAKRDAYLTLFPDAEAID